MKFKKKDKEENKSQKNSNNSLFLIIGIVTICAALALFYYFALYFAPVSTVPYSGYIVEAKKIAKNLKSENFESAETVLPLVKVEDQETIYKKVNDYYVGGDKKKSIDINYPIYINDESAVLNLSGDIKLITRNFEKIEGYANSILTEGTLYNSYDLSKADTNEYIFVETNENTYITTKEIKITTTTKEYTIPVNSIIYFTQNYITFYKLNGKSLNYFSIANLTLDDKITLENIGEMTYEEFLQKMGIIQVNTKNEEPAPEPEKEEPPKKEEKENKEEEPKKEEEAKEEYVKPTITAEDFSAGIYTAKTSVRIVDPQGRITEAIFIIKREGKIYQRKQISGGGTIEINGLLPETTFKVEGTYRYKNQENKEVEAKFYEGEFTTKSIDSLGVIEFKHTPGDIFSTKMELKEFTIVSNISEEMSLAIAKIEIEIGGLRYRLNSEEISNLKENKEIVFQTSETLKSNQDIHYVIHAYDKFGNELRTQNVEGDTYTSKEAPTANISLITQESILTELDVVITNKDNAELKNMYYVISTNGEEFAREPLEDLKSLVSRTDLDPNGYYTISIYADYDLEDKKGLRENNLLAELNFTTIPLSRLGSIYWKTETYLKEETQVREDGTEEIVKELQLTKDSATIKVQIDTVKTDIRLVQLIAENEFIVKDADENIVFSCPLDLVSVKSGEEILVEITGLESNTEYFYDIETILRQGSIEDTAKRDLTTNSFITRKKPAEVNIQNPFVTGELIDFDVKIIDVDEAILTNMARMEVREIDSRTGDAKLIDMKNIETKQDIIGEDDFKRQVYDSLKEDTNYTITFFAEQYNEGHDNTTYIPEYVLYEWNIFTNTSDSISGKIEPLSLSRKTKKENDGSINVQSNLINVESEVNWLTSTMFNTGSRYYKSCTYDSAGNPILNLSSNNYVGRYVYDFKQAGLNAGDTVTISFSAKLTKGTIYLQNGEETNTNNKEICEKLELNSNNYKNFTKTLTLRDGYLGFYLPANSGVTIQKLYVYAGENRGYTYRRFSYDMELESQITITDRRPTQAEEYYVRLYKNDEFLKEYTYDDFIREDGHSFVKTVKYYRELEEETNCRIELLIKVRDRYYTLDSYETFIKKGDEIKAISNEEEYLRIAPYGHYIVLNDLNFSGAGSKYYFNGWSWQGTLDFNGHTVEKASLDTSSGMFGTIGKKGIVENLVLNYRLNHIQERSGVYGLFYTSEGTVRNLQLNLIESNSLANTTVCLLGYLQEPEGVVEKFVINMQEPIYGAMWLTAGIRYNRGTIRNGYIYGKNIEASHSLVSGQSRNVGVVACTNYISARIENVYTLASVNNQIYTGVTNSIGNICNSNSGKATVKNVYSVYTEGIGMGEGEVITRGPNVYDPGGTVKNNYYFCDKIFNNTANQKTSILALSDVNFQNKMLNSSSAFNVDELVLQGYYPQVKMPSVMPRQEYIKYPTIEDDGDIDIKSTEVLEKDDEKNEALIQCNVHNPNGDPITNIKIENLSTKIESQEYDNGITTVKLRVSDPVLCVSQYNILSISRKGSTGFTYAPKTFKLGERVVELEFYRKVYNVNANEDGSWKQIKQSPKENYKIMEDLNFGNWNKDDIVINTTYTGILDGNNKSIVNMTIDNSLISTFNGKMSNITFKNIKFEGIPLSLALIAKSQSNSYIENVHMQDITINSLATTETETAYIGALIASSERGTIQNCSVKNLNISVKGKLYGARIGGLIAYNTGGTISNCYSIKSNIVIENVENSYGIGGIIGTGTSYCLIENCYSEGKIKSNAGTIGGIVGTVNESVIKNCYALQEIETIREYVGEIVGDFACTGNVENSYYNLALGDVYTRMSTKNIHRIIGIARSAATENFAYTNQKINSSIINDSNYQSKGLSSKNDDAKELFDEEALSKKETYTEKLFWATDYDYSNIKDESGNTILPKLYYKDTTELLPYQEDIYIGKKANNDLEIDEFSTRKSGNEYANVQLTLKSNNTITEELQGLELHVENMDISNIKQQYSGNYLQIQFEVRPREYYDSYQLESLSYYDDNGNVINLPLKLKIDEIFYKVINNKSEWYSDLVPRAQGTYQNFLLKLDLEGNEIDFGDDNDLKNNLTIGRLETMSASEEGKCTLKNINVKITGKNQGFIADVATKMSNISFENVTIDNKTSAEYSTIGIIGKSHAIIENVSFINVHINTSTNSSKNSYTGIIGRTFAGKVSNITLKGITVKGKTYVGGLIGDVVGGEIDTVTATRIDPNNATSYSLDIYGTGNFVGGIVGRQESYTSTLPNRFKKSTVVNAKIVSGGSYAGGVIGYGLSTSESIVRNSEITGASYVGGIGGIVTTTYDTVTTFISDHNVIKGTGSYVGGIYGQWGYHSTPNGQKTVTNCTITAGGNYVGGITGYSGLRLIYCAVKDTTIYAKNSTYVGGITGICNGDCSIYWNYVQNSNITGYAKVGGIIGSYAINSLYNCYVNANITANNTVGGIIGYLDNAGMTAANRVSTVYNTYTAGTTISGDAKVGGIIGDCKEEIFEKSISTYYYRRNLVEAKLISKNMSETSFGIGGKKSENQKLYKTWVYKYSTMKIGEYEPEYISTVNDTFLESQYVGLDLLSSRSNFYWRDFYLSWPDSYFNYSKLDENKYPTLNNGNLLTQDGISLPTEPVTSEEPNEDTTQNSTPTQSANIPSEIGLPTITQYTIGVNKFNIDLSKTDENTKLTYSSENTEPNTIPITERTYTFEYNYQSDVTLTLENETESKTIVLTADEIKNKSSLQKDTVAYIEENKLFVNGQEIEGTFENLIDGKALATDGNIYDIDKSTYEENEQVELKLVETEPKAKQDYKENEIETYGTYSIVNGKIVDKIYTVSNGVLSITDGLLENVKSNKIIDNYNEKEIETILGTDGVLYDLKDEITYPKDFKNSNIEFITVNTETDEKTVAVSYDDGSLVVFNYMTGKVTFEKEKTKTESESKLSLLDYILEKIGIGETKQEENLTNSVNVTENDNILEQPNTQVEQNEELLVTDYAETKQIEKKLQEKPIDSESGKNIDYVTTYNSATKSYEIYKEDALLNKETDDEVVESETKKIAANEELKKFYLESDVEKTKINDKGVYFIVGSIASVFVALIILRRYIISKRKQIILEKRRNRAKKNK